MLNSTDGKKLESKEYFVFSKTIFWMQFIFFGGWNGLQILLQPQDLAVFVAERGFLDNFFFTVSYSWNNIPLIYIILVSLGIFWNYQAVSLDFQMINNLKKNDDVGIIPYKDKDNIIIFITALNLLVWILCLAIIYLLPYWNAAFLTDLFYDVAGIDKVKEPLYILLILITCSINLMIRIQLLLFYEGGCEHSAITKFISSFLRMKAYFVKAFLFTLLATTISTLVYKQFILGFIYKLKVALPSHFLVNFHLMVNRVDVLMAIPSIILLFLVSCLCFSPLVIYVYTKIINSQYEFYKEQYLKEKIKKDIDENFESIILNNNEI